MPTENPVTAYGEHLQQVVEQWGDGKAYDRERYITEARFYLEESAGAMLQAGRRLIVLKEAEPHGDFIRIIQERLGLAPRTAQQLMKAASKFLTPQLQAATPRLTQLGKSKLFELMVEDDEDLEALAEGGTVAGMTLDDVDRMSVRELRQALRQAREDNDQELTAKDRVIADKSAKIDKLQTQLERKRLKPTPPSTESRELREEAGNLAFDAEALIRGQVLPAFQQVVAHADEHGIDVTGWIGGQLDQLSEALDYLRGELGFLPWQAGEVADDLPAWDGQAPEPLDETLEERREREADEALKALEGELADADPAREEQP